MRQMRDEIARGHRASDAAVLVKARAETELPQQALIDEFLDAAYRLDPRGVDDLLERSRGELGVDDAICDVLLPGMRQIGRWWEAGRCDISHEHLATEAARAWLNRLLYLGPSPAHTETVILTCGPRDFHTLGLESLAVLLAQRGYGCRVLGARTPARSLATAVQGTDASAVVMVSHLAVGRRSAVEALRAAQLGSTQLFYAGNAFATPQARQSVPGTYLGEDLIAATELVIARLRNGSPRPEQATGREVPASR